MPRMRKQRRLSAALVLALLASSPLHLAVAAEKPSKMSPSWVVVPGKSLGPIRLGMSEAEVIAAVGNPDRTKFGSWEYFGGGYSLSFDPDNRTVSAILGGGAGGFLHARFLARTAEGIGMGSTRSEVTAALGRPETYRRDADSEFMLYRAGLTLTLIRGVVVHVDVEPERPYGQ
jgi:hypothetical protein